MGKAKRKNKEKKQKKTALKILLAEEDKNKGILTSYY